MITAQPPQTLTSRVWDIINRNRRNAGLIPLTKCGGGCGRMIELAICNECAEKAWS